MGKIERGRGIEKPEAVRDNQEQGNRADAKEKKFGVASLAMVRSPQGQLEIGHGENKRQDEEYGKEKPGFLQQEAGEKSDFGHECGQKSEG